MANPDSPFFAEASWVRIFREGKKRRANFISDVCSNHLGTLGSFIVVDIHMANMDSLFFRVLLLYLYFLYFFVVGCLGHDFLDGLRPP